MPICGRCADDAAIICASIVMCSPALCHPYVGAHRIQVRGWRCARLCACATRVFRRARHRQYQLHGSGTSTLTPMRAVASTAIHVIERRQDEQFVFLLFVLYAAYVPSTMRLLKPLQFKRPPSSATSRWRASCRAGTRHTARALTSCSRIICFARVVAPRSCRVITIGRSCSRCRSWRPSTLSVACAADARRPTHDARVPDLEMMWPYRRSPGRRSPRSSIVGAVCYLHRRAFNGKGIISLK